MLHQLHRVHVLLSPRARARRERVQERAVSRRGDGPARYDRVHLLPPVLAVPGQPRDQRSTSGGGGEPAGWRPATASDRRASAAGASGVQVSESSTSDREG